MRTTFARFSNIDKSVVSDMLSEVLYIQLNYVIVCKKTNINDRMVVGKKRNKYI